MILISIIVTGVIAKRQNNDQTTPTTITESCYQALLNTVCEHYHGKDPMSLLMFSVLPLAWPAA